MRFLKYGIDSIKKLLMKSVLWVLSTLSPVSSWNTVEESETLKVAAAEARAAPDSG